MKLSDFDAQQGHPLREALQWLETCIKSPATTWNPEQRAAASKVLMGARILLLTGVFSAWRIRVGDCSWVTLDAAGSLEVTEDRDSALVICDFLHTKAFAQRFGTSYRIEPATP